MSDEKPSNVVYLQPRIEAARRTEDAPKSAHSARVGDLDAYRTRRCERAAKAAAEKALDAEVWPFVMGSLRDSNRWKIPSGGARAAARFTVKELNEAFQNIWIEDIKESMGRFFNANGVYTEPVSVPSGENGEEAITFSLKSDAYFQLRTQANRNPQQLANPLSNPPRIPSPW